jgi:hypothetical protein
VWQVDLDHFAAACSSAAHSSRRQRHPSTTRACFAAVHGGPPGDAFADVFGNFDTLGDLDFLDEHALAIQGGFAWPPAQVESL